MKLFKIQLLILFVILNSSHIIIHYEPISKLEYYYEILSKKYKALNEEVIQEIFYCGQKFNIEPELLIAISMQESGLNQYAVNSQNINRSVDKGYMQLNNKYFNAPNIYDTQINIFLGSHYFRYCLDRSKGNIREALYIYNSGKFYPVHNEAERRADYIIFTYLKLKYSYQKYLSNFVIKYL